MNFLDYYFKVINKIIICKTYFCFLFGRDVYCNIKNTIPINTNIPIIGRRTNNQEILVNPFLHNTLSNHVHNATYNNLTAKKAKL